MFIYWPGWEGLLITLDIIFCHGGDFIFGGIDIYSPEYIMEEDIVLVTIQYRLNIFGYMSTEDAITPGNYGSLDQVEALKWIQENIVAYGGDPDKVHTRYLQ